MSDPEPDDADNVAAASLVEFIFMRVSLRMVDPYYFEPSNIVNLFNGAS